SGRIAGTLAYMSPEQLTGGPIDARSDLFSFGAVLFEMASGHRAFSRAPVDGTAAIQHERSPRVTDLNRDVPGALADVIGKALEPDLDRRYQRASDIRADLRRAAREWESRQSRSEAAGRLWTVRRVAAAAAVAAALALALALMVSARPGAPPVAKTTQSVAVLPFKPLVAGDTDDTYLGLGIADALIMQL